MEKFSYNSYPESTDSSPRSREIEFDNPPPWDDQNPNQNPNQNQNQQSYKVRFMCSYGGKIQPRPHDNQLTYVNGETKILSVDRGIRFPVLASKLSAVCGGGGGGDDVTFKYQLPGEDLDALISVTNDDDLEHMMHEYDRLLRMSSKPARMRLFLFPSSGGFGSQGSTHSDRDRFVEALNTVPRLSDSEKSVTAPPPPPNNADFLFGSDKVVAPPPPITPPEAKLPVPAVLEPPLFNDPRVIQPEIQRQMQEFQRMHIRDQEQQQQEAVYRRKSNEDGLIETTGGGYFSPPYAQNPPPQPMITQTNPQAPSPPMTTFWQGNHNPGGVFPTTTPGLGLTEQPVYMIPTPTPSPVYHAPPQGMMRPVNQGGYYPPVQRMVSDTYREQHQTPPYNVAQLPIGTKAQQQQQPPPPFTSVGAPPPPFTSVGTPPPPQYSAVPPPRQVVGLPPDTSAYTQVSYAGGMGKQVYYTEAAPPPPAQYHGIGLPVNGMGEVRSGPDGKLIAMNMATKVSSQSSDSAV
ncbi:PREDICTED: proline-rich receptor-like protein kinase PERK10 [Camelina sativa]|uniref:Proline-rich receptor-like protein kinase PERK10 n=1 Tax=Camelina sativa TaxID=90675 RepID=A0ABM0VVR9_CAMSA|nr:PREDICTED: proline-rich receptor-like protein kinase PERK10 [Camelina sativa]